MTMAIFIKLFATKIDASNFFGCLRRSIMISKDFDLVFLASSKSFCVNEKRATSAPEIRAEQIKSTSNPIAPLNKVLSKKNAILAIFESNYKLIKMVSH